MRQSKLLAVFLAAFFVFAATGRAQTKPADKVVYVCPMHPNVISDRPGKCPECGMNLVKKTMTTPVNHDKMNMGKMEAKGGAAGEPANCCDDQPSGTMAAKKISVPGGTYSNVEIADLKDLLAKKDFFLVNVHIPYAGEIAATDAFVPYNEIEKSISIFPVDKNAKIVLYCRSGHMSATAAETLVKLGFKNVWNVEGGMVAWKKAGNTIFQK